MKLNKLTMALIAAGAFATTGAIADNHIDTYEEGNPPNLTIEQEIMVVLYEAMLSAGGMMVVETSCETLQNNGPYSFVANVDPAFDRGILQVGNDASNPIYFTAKHDPEDNPLLQGRGNQYYLAQGIIQNFPAGDGELILGTDNTEDGVFYQGGLELAKFNNVTGYTIFKPAFSANSAIFLNNAYARISSNWPSVPGSVLDEHVIKDFYKLDNVEGKCTSEDQTTAPTLCDADNAFFDWGLEVITKWDYPEYKFRQDSQHVPWDGTNGWWYIRKRLIADGSDFDFFPTPECLITAEGVYTGTAAGDGAASYTGELTFEQTGNYPGGQTPVFP